MYVRGPQVLYARGAQADTEVMPVPDAEWKRAPTAVRDPITVAERDLAALGFGAATRGASRLTTVSSCVSLCEHASGAALASVLVMLTERGSCSTTLRFVSELADGVMVETANSPNRRRFPRSTRHHGVSFPEVRDVAALYALHSTRVRTLAGDRPPRAMTRGADPLAHARAEGAEFWARMVAAGYYRATGDGRHALTRRGAVFATWRGMFPWAQLTDWRDERHRSHWRRLASAA
jgi:hypothetical protein